MARRCLISIVKDEFDSLCAYQLIMNPQLPTQITDFTPQSEYQKSSRLVSAQSQLSIQISDFLDIFNPQKVKLISPYPCSNYVTTIVIEGLGCNRLVIRKEFNRHIFYDHYHSWFQYQHMTPDKSSCVSKEKDEKAFKEHDWLFTLLTIFYDEISI